MIPRRAAVAVLAAVVAVATLVAPAQALDLDPEAPVVVDDTVTMWPGESITVDVLANDSDPGGDDLALCRLPPVRNDSDTLPVVIWDRSWLASGEPRVLSVATGWRSAGTHTVEYYVCNHTRLTLAHLTVTIRPVQPVDVVKADAPGRIVVTSHNDQKVVFRATDSTGCATDIRAVIAAGETRSFRVRRHTLKWTAYIEDGVADFGTIRRIELTRPPLPPEPDLIFCF